MKCCLNCKVSKQMLGLALIALSLFAATGRVSAQYTYTTVLVPGATSDTITAMNDSGEVAGTYSGAAGSGIYTYLDGTYTTIAPQNADAGVDGISDSGELVGNYYNNNSNYGFEYSNGLFSPVQYPGSASTRVAGISQTGEIYGSYTIAGDSTDYAFTDIAGVFTTFTIPNATRTYITSINAEGEIAGDYSTPNMENAGSTFGFTELNGEFNIVNVAGQLDMTGITTVNNSGEVAGDWFNSEVDQGYTESNGVYTLLKLAYRGTFVTGLSSSGEVAGYFYTNGPAEGFVDINGTIDDISLDSSTEIYGINNSGQIFGLYGQYSYGPDQYAFIGTPTPAPELSTSTTLALILTLTAGMWFKHRKRTPER